ncbi:MAG TPA: sulfite oxidase-like oxidoreductase, partial [Dehalococcoidia bacterium]|nr:sulfite oxidase-like oxidoreductase [Dehalococcoidia bacterium]
MVFGSGRREKDREKFGERIPPNQYVVDDWPVLTYGPTPKVDLDKWRLRLFGEVESEVELTWEQFTSLPVSTTDVDIHCVTGWSRFDNHWEGVAFRDLLSQVQPKPGTKAVMAHSYGGYTTNILLSDLMQDNVMVAYKHDGNPLEIDHGGPARLMVPHLYFWKSAKWLHALQFLPDDKPGFWEVNGYHIRGDPWKEERYS